MEVIHRIHYCIIQRNWKEEWKYTLTKQNRNVVYSHVCRTQGRIQLFLVTVAEWRNLWGFGLYTLNILQGKLIFFIFFAMEKSKWFCLAFFKEFFLVICNTVWYRNLTVAAATIATIWICHWCEDNEGLWYKTVFGWNRTSV